MTRLISSELLALRTVRSLAVIPIAALGLVGVAAADWIAKAGSGGVPALATAEHAAQLLVMPGLGGVPLLLFGVALGCVEFRHGTVVGLLLVAPSRSRFVAAKAATAALVALGWVQVCLAMTAGMALAAGGDLAPVREAGMVSQVARALLPPVPLAVLGVGVGVAVRNQALAVALTLAWAVQLESELAARFAGLGRWLPLQSAMAAGGGGITADPLAPGAALAMLVVWAALSTVVGAATLARRDL